MLLIPLYPTLTKQWDSIQCHGGIVKWVFVEIMDKMYTLCDIFSSKLSYRMMKTGAELHRVMKIEIPLNEILTVPQSSLTASHKWPNLSSPKHTLPSVWGSSKHANGSQVYANEISFQALISDRGWPAELSDLARLPAGAPISSILPQHILCVTLQISSGPARYPVQPAWISTPLNLAPRDSLCSSKMPRWGKERRQKSRRSLSDSSRCMPLHMFGF